MKNTRKPFLYPFGAIVLIVICFWMFVPAVSAETCEVNNQEGNCATVDICAYFPTNQNLGRGSCPSGQICCFTPEVEAPPTVTAPTGTQVTEEKKPGKGKTTVGYGLRNPLGSRTVPEIIGAIIGWASGLAGALFMLYLIWGGIEWMTAGGSADRLKSGQKKILYAIFGIVIVVLSYFLVDMIIGLTNIPPGT